MREEIKISRRKFLKFAGITPLFLSVGPLILSACEKRYERPAGIVKLGKLKDLLYSKAYLPEENMLVYRDQTGWSALSTRCTYQGCDLTYQENALFCPCCRGYYDHQGNILSGPSVVPLPWYEIRYAEGELMADTGKKVAATYRFSTPALDSAIKKLGLEIRERKLGDVKVPKILIGEGPTQGGPMFRDTDPNEVWGSEMIK